MTVTANVYDGDGVSIGDNITCSEVGSLAIYLGDMPAASSGRYYVRFFNSGNLLAQAPYGQVAALITKISNQAQKQIDQIPKVEKVK